MILVKVYGVTVYPPNQGYAVLLKEEDGDRILPIIVGSFEAQSIAFVLEGIEPPRPITHDLVKRLLDSLESTIAEVIVNDLRDNTFYAIIGLESGKARVDVDARPSDAIAVALRVNAPIYVAESVMERAALSGDLEISDGEIKLDGKKFNFDDEKKEDHAVNEFTRLKQKLKEAIKREDYEKAAILRDKIQDYKGDKN